MAVLLIGVVSGLGTMGIDVSGLIAGLGLTGFALGFVSFGTANGGAAAVNLAKIAAAVAAVEVVARLWPDVATAGLWGKLGIVLRLGALTLTFAAVALATRALTVADLRGLRRAA